MLFKHINYDMRNQVTARQSSTVLIIITQFLNIISVDGDVERPTTPWDSEQMLCTPCPGSPHARTHIVHISLIHSIIGKYVTHVPHKHMRLCTVSCPITHQRGSWTRAFHLVKWVSFWNTFLPSPSISKQPLNAIGNYPFYLETISLAD